ncbi:formate dehydrogenase [Herbaspirillum sp. HC18]|nr:formate dehydrogenase [Herbaspirillum sp. HC18]
MDINKLVHMANQIGAFFESMPDRNQAVSEVAGHLKRFWDPRMRKALLGYVDEQGGAELKPIVLEAVQAHKSAIE